MTKKILLALLGGFIVLMFPILMFTLDYSMAVKDSPPLFAVRTEIYKDGGTSVYQGLGYKIIDYNQMDGRQDVVFKSKFVSKGKE